MVSFTVYKGSEEGKIVESTTTREVGPDEVLIKISHSGVCGTDEHQLHRDMVLGHEGVGTIVQLGSEVTTFSIGERVGWGFVHDSCGFCEYCLEGQDNRCLRNKRFARDNLDQGSFGTYAVWKANFVYKIPESIALAHAAPLMCGGATVFHVLHSFGVKTTQRVGVIGIGGLGHLAIQFAAKMGCEVVVFSSTESKRAEAMALGATQFIVLQPGADLDIKHIHHLIITTSKPPEWKKFVPILAPGAAIYPLTIAAGDFALPYENIIFSELRIQGSMVATRKVYKQMLAFAAIHDIKPIIEEFPMSTQGVVDAMGRLREGNMRYRGVLVAPA